MSGTNQQLDHHRPNLQNAESNKSEMTNNQASGQSQRLFSSSKPWHGTQVADFVIQKMSIVDRLHHRRKSRLAHIQDKIYQSKGSLPNGRLPAWNKLNLGHKIPVPRILNHRSGFTRGEICQDLHRHTNAYILDDKDRVLKDSYNALHDPSTQSYFQNPTVQRLLIKQGLITPQGEVVCSLIEFNKWRAYLSSTIHSDKVKEALNQLDLVRKTNREQTKRIQNFSSHQSILSRHYLQIQRFNKASQLKHQRHKAETKKCNERELLKAERRNRYEMKMTRQQVERVLRTVQREEKHMRKLLQVEEAQVLIRNKMVQRIQEKEQDAKIRKEAQTKFGIAVKEQKYMESLHAQYQNKETENLREAIIDDFLRKETRKAAAAWQRRIEKRRPKIHQICEGNPLRDRDDYLSRKYCKKWSSFVTNRKIRQLSRQSAFHLPTSLELTLKFMLQNIDTIRPRSSSAPPLMMADETPLKKILDKSVTEEIQIQGLPCHESTAHNAHANEDPLVSIEKSGTTKKMAGLCKTVRIKRAPSKSCHSTSTITATEDKIKTKILVEETVKLLLDDAYSICKTVVGIKRRYSKKKTSKVSKAITQKDVGNQKLKEDVDSGAIHTNTKLFSHFVDESIPVELSSFSSMLSRRPIHEAITCEAESNPIIVLHSNAETKPVIFTPAPSESRIDGTEYLFYTTTQEAQKMMKSISLSTLALSSEDSEGEDMEFKSLQTEVLGDVIGKQSIFTSSVSYTKFADQVYEEMTSRGIAGEKTKVSMLIEKKVRENNLQILKQDFFRRLLMLCVSDEDVKLTNKLNKLSNLKSEGGNANKRSRNRSRAVAAVRDTSFCKRQISLPRFSRTEELTPWMSPRSQKSTPMIGDEEKQETIEKVVRSASNEFTSIKRPCGKQQRLRTVKESGSTNSSFTRSLEGTNEVIRSENMAFPSHDLILRTDAEPNILKKTAPEEHLSQMMKTARKSKSIETKQTSKLIKLFKTLDIRSSDSNTQLQKQNPACNSPSFSPSISHSTSSGADTKSRVNILQPLKSTLDRLLPNYKFSELCHLDPFILALRTDEEKLRPVPPRATQFKLPFAITADTFETGENTTTEKDSFASTQLIKLHQNSYSAHSNVEKSTSVANMHELGKIVTNTKEPMSNKSETLPDLKIRECKLTPTKYVSENSILPSSSIKSSRTPYPSSLKQSLLKEILEFIGIIIHHRVLQNVFKIRDAVSSTAQYKVDYNADKVHTSVRNNIVRLALDLHDIEKNNKKTCSPDLEHHKNFLDQIIECTSTLIIARFVLECHKFC